MKKQFLPISKDDMKSRGWSRLDVILVTGDAYVDHPSYGVSVIGRVLEDAGFKIGVIAQPDWRRTGDFLRLGKPRLFFGVTAGNLDSMVANYTANKRPRRSDDYSPGGRAGLRPDRATIVYTNRLKEAFPETPVVLGGIEASLRRLAHYDYWSDKVRRSILLDAKADILVYGMGERQIVEIARRLDKGEDIKSLDNIRGTAVARRDISILKDYLAVPSFEETRDDKNKFNLALKTAFLEADPFRGRTLIQRHGDRFVIQSPPAMPFKEAELDRIYLLNYARDWHPVYGKEGGVPGFETVRFSIISHRGCAGGCNFCSLYFHQGRIVQSRSAASIIEEARRLSAEEYFRGTITDIGGPTANFYKARCALWKGVGACRDKNCVTPGKCKDLNLGYDDLAKLLEDLRKLPRAKNVFIGSGVRHDLLTEGYSGRFLEALSRHHVSGQLKVAPEHCADGVLKLMGKPSFDAYERFAKRFEDINKRLDKKQYLVNYFMIGHPGCSLKEMLELALYLVKRRIHPEQVQDFIPLPLTISGAMYYTEKDPFAGKPVYVARTMKERKMQRALVQYNQPANRRLVLEALKELGRMDLRRLFISDKRREWNTRREGSEEYLF